MVTLTQGFYLGKYEVTQAQYEAVMTDNNASLSSHAFNTPVQIARTGQLGRHSNLSGAFERALQDNLPPGWAYVLPTEAEWEYLSVAGTAYFGETISLFLANYQLRMKKMPYRREFCGFFDMHKMSRNWTQIGILRCRPT